DMEARVETSHEWIVERTGIEQRHIAADGELTSDLGIAAAKDALTNAGIDANTIDTIICATVTPDDTMPATATKIQRGIGAAGAAAFDLNAACSGFVYAASVAHGLIMSGQSKRLMIVGAETYSRILDWNDRGTCI